MQKRTAFRLAMLANGFQPLLNDCKRPIEKGWPQRTVDEAEVLAWDRSALLSTGLKLDGDLAVIDIDVTDVDLVEALADALGKNFPALFEHGLVRHTGGPKEAWIARVDEPFQRLASRRWYRGGDPDDPAVAKHLVECFGSLGTRQFAIDGPHARNQVGEASMYTNLLAAPRRRRRRGQPCPCCRKQPTNKLAIYSMGSRQQQGSPRSREAARTKLDCAASSSTPIPRSKRAITAG